MAEKEPLALAKKWLRAYLIRERQSLSVPERKRRSKKAIQNLMSTPAYKRARTVALFLSFGSEIDTHDLVRHAWRAKKQVLIPISELGFDKSHFALFRPDDKLRETPYGPLELVEKKSPFNFKRIDLVVVPGLGFDRRLYRLGYGGGVYDRILTQAPRAKHIGLFYSNQELPHIPTGAHDHPLSAVVTDKELL